jgi:deazaflavin-dependent oxidoreductase (nitroreductase family)
MQSRCGTRRLDTENGTMRAHDHPNNAPGVPMKFPPWFERLQIKYVNPIAVPIARFMPGITVISHRGRKSGTQYQTAVSAYRKGSTLAIMLAHGKTNWVKNILSAGEADIRMGGRDLHLVNPRIVTAGTDDASLPLIARIAARRGVGVFVADIAS